MACLNSIILPKSSIKIHIISPPPPASAFYSGMFSSLPPLGQRRGRKKKIPSEV